MSKTLQIANYPTKYENQSALCCGNCLLALRGEGIKRDSEEVGAYLPDMCLPDIPGPGLWVWDGTMVWEDEVPLYIGAWRRPSVDDVAALAAGDLLPDWQEEGEWVLE